MDNEYERIAKAAVGCLLGTAVGDAIGLPAEGLSKRRLGRIYPRINEHHFVLGRGMISDDTEHTCMVARSLIASGGDKVEFTRYMSRLLRLWILALPAGAGLATLKATLKLLFGCSPFRSGVFSAGNGPAMRSAIIGVCYSHDIEKMRELVHMSTRITHTDSKAEFGAMAVALAAYYSSICDKGDTSPRHYFKQLRDILGSDASDLLELIHRAIESAEMNESTEIFASSIGCGNGVSGYVYSTVPVALHAWMTHPNDYHSAVTAVVRCGGDTDTLAAIVGGIVGSRTGKHGIPGDWLQDLCDWPQSTAWIEKLGNCLAESVYNGKPMKPLQLSSPGIYARNLLFLIIVLVHGFRRMLPPY